MSINPYKPSSITAATASDFSGPTFAFIGLLLGMLQGALSGFLGGSLTGATYRGFHDVAYSPSMLYGFLGRTSTYSDFALRFGISAVIPTAVWYGFAGCFYAGWRTSQHSPSPRLPIYATGGMVIGLLNGISALPGRPEILPHFLEGPAAGAVFGATAAVLGWFIFQKTLIRILHWSRGQKVWFLLGLLSVVHGGVLIACAALRAQRIGGPSTQLVVQVLIVCTFIGLCVVVGLMRRHHRLASRRT